MGILQSFLMFLKSSDPTEDLFLPPKFQPVVKGTKIKMLRTMRGSPDGAHVQEFTEGETYKTTERLAEALVEAGFAEEA